MHLSSKRKVVSIMRVVLLVLSIVFSNGLLAQSWVSGVKPVANTKEIIPSQPIEIQFNQPIQSSRLNNAAVIIYGAKSGHHSFQHQWDAQKMLLKLILEGPFVPGEQVQIAITPDILPVNHRRSNEMFHWSYYISKQLEDHKRGIPPPNFL